MSKLDEYRAGTGPIPQTMLRWHFYGNGLDGLRLEEVPVPKPGAHELLVRQDANGICFSDIKVITLGENHPRLQGRDLSRNPVTLGHEVSCTVVGVGSELIGRFHVGQRFIIQADVFYKGVSMAYGYVFPGGLSEYSIIPKEMIEGDEGCYLVPINPRDGYVEAALVEPWACVVSAYMQAHRPGLKPGGRLLVIEGENASQVDCAGMVGPSSRPASVTVVGSCSGVAGAGLEIVGSEKVTELATVADWAELKQAHADGVGFDDILILGSVAPEVAEMAANVLADHGIFAVITDRPFPRKLSLDIGRVHYNWHHYVGTATGKAADAYRSPRGAELKPGGVAWFIGAGGPMGQMHVQRAVMLPQPPRRIVATDIDSERLQSVGDRFGATAKSRGVELVLLNPQTMDAAAFDAELHKLADGRGFDDIVSLVPVPALIEHASAFLADGAWFNIFAGVARGTMAQLDYNAIVMRGVRYVGSSGSSLADMRQALEKMETGQLDTNMSLAAIGGMRAAREGIRAVKEARFPGKTVIFPLIHDLPLTPVPQIGNLYPSVAAKLKGGQFWTREAEEELLRLTLGREEA